MLLYNAIKEVLERKAPDGKNIPVDLSFIKQSSGEIIDCRQVRVIYFDQLYNNYRLQFPNGQIRDVKKISIIKINNHEVILK